MDKVTVVGTTTWGTTLAVLLARKGVPVTLLARTQEEATGLEAARRNRRFLSQIEFPPSLGATHSPDEAMAGTDMIVLAVPCRSFRDNVNRISASMEGTPILLSVSKGLEMETGMRMSEVLEDELPSHMHNGICVLSGPNLAREIMEGKPAFTVIASGDGSVAEEAQRVLMSPAFRVYTNRDTVGVELGGALKNIIALGAGICDGLGFGDNGKAGFMTRGLAEITRLGVAAGASPITFAGLAGLGDLVATCASPISRNHYVGEQLAAGRPLQDILDSMDNVAEGVYTTVAAMVLAERYGVEMPITRATYQILMEGLDPRQAVAELMERPPRPEWEGIV